MEAADVLGRSTNPLKRTTAAQWARLGVICISLMGGASMSSTWAAETPKKSVVTKQKTAKTGAYQLPPELEKLKRETIARILKILRAGPVLRPELSVTGLYDSFKFNSVAGDAYNHFYGHTQLINLGGGNLTYRDYITGFGVTAVNTRLKSNFSPALLNEQISSTSIDNTMINAHVMRRLPRNFSVDVLGGLGQSQFTINNTVIYPAVPDFADIISLSKNGSGRLWGFNQYLGARFSAFQVFNQWILQEDAGYVFSNFQQPAYTINYSDGTSNHVPSLITRVGLLTENASLRYSFNDYLQPYVMAGLVQVASLTYSNPIVQLTTASPLPQQIISNSGFLLGAGLTYRYKNLRLGPIYQYSQRGTNYVDNLGALKIDLIL